MVWQTASWAETAGVVVHPLGGGLTGVGQPQGCQRIRHQVQDEDTHEQDQEGEDARQEVGDVQVGVNEVEVLGVRQDIPRGQTLTSKCSQAGTERAVPVGEAVVVVVVPEPFLVARLLANWYALASLSDRGFFRAAW